MKRLTSSKVRRTRSISLGINLGIIGAILIVVVILGLAAINGGFHMFSAKKVPYKNPVGDMTNIGDPFVLKDDDQYYLYATSAPKSGFKVWKSDNLVDWTEVGLAYNHGTQADPWATGDFWAPEVVRYEDKYVMTFSARNRQGSLRISIATADQPEGPFIDQNTDLIPEKGSYIDAHILIDDDGIPYLYYVKDNYENVVAGKHVSHIYVRRMTDDLVGVSSEEPILLLKPDQAWESPHDAYQWNEGPFVLKQNGTYYLMYSANYFASHDYAIGYAFSDSPTGPFKKSDSNPVLAKNLAIGISGPGHNSVIKGFDNKTLYIVYHIHTNPKHPSGDRRMAIDRLYFDGDELKVDGPTADQGILK